METQDEDYEFEERAAIREFEADQPRNKAEFFARQEIQIRTVQQNTLSRKQQDRKRQQNEPKKIQQPKQKQPLEGQGLRELRDRRDEVSKKMTAEKDPKRKNELFTEWKELLQKIFKIIDKGV